MTDKTENALRAFVGLLIVCGAVATCYVFDKPRKPNPHASRAACAVAGHGFGIEVNYYGGTCYMPTVHGWVPFRPPIKGAPE